MAHQFTDKSTSNSDNDVPASEERTGESVVAGGVASVSQKTGVDAATRTTSSLQPVISMLKQCGITDVAIIDDAFNHSENDWAKVDNQARAQFIENLRDDQLASSELSELLGQAIPEDEDLVTDQLIATLFEKRSEAKHSLRYIDLLLNSVEVKVNAGDLQRFCDNLNSLELRFQKFGERDSVANLPDIVFMDWRLENSSAEADPVKAAVKKVREVIDQWPATVPRPFIVLMSSRTVNEIQQNEFLHSSGLLGGMFHFLRKDELEDPIVLSHFLAALAFSWSTREDLQHFQEALEKAAEEAKKKFCEDTRRLRREDYTYIQNLALQKEGHPLGDYMLWLYANYISHLIRANGDLRERQDKIDAKNALDIAPRLSNPSPTLATIYHAAVFDSVNDIGHHPRSGFKEDVDIAEPYLELGDIFWRHGDVESDTLSKDSTVPRVEENTSQPQATENLQSVSPTYQLVHMLISPACDLAFSPDAADDRPFKRNLPLILLRGKLIPLMAPFVHNGVQTELFMLGSETYRVCWDRKRFISMPYKDFMGWKRGVGNDTQHGSYTRIARMKLPFVLEVQHEFASDLSRIATPVAPPLSTEVSAQFLYQDKDGNPHRLIEVENEQDGTHDDTQLDIVSKSSFKRGSKRQYKYRLSFKGWVALHHALNTVLAKGETVLGKARYKRLTALIENIYTKHIALNSEFEAVEKESPWPQLEALGLVRNKDMATQFTNRDIVVYLNIKD